MVSSWTKVNEMRSFRAERRPVFHGGAKTGRSCLAPRRLPESLPGRFSLGLMQTLGQNLHCRRRQAGAKSRQRAPAAELLQGFRE